MGETTQRKREGEVWRSMTEEGEKKRKGMRGDGSRRNWLRNEKRRKEERKQKSWKERK